MSSISSIVSPVAPIPVQATEQQQPPRVDNDADDSRTAPPPVKAALPPGQGTRVDQFA